MSYCRWSDGDVYAYDCAEGVQFWIAGHSELDRLCATHTKAYDYAIELRNVHGVQIPDYAVEALRFEADAEVKSGHSIDEGVKNG